MVIAIGFTVVVGSAADGTVMRWGVPLSFWCGNIPIGFMSGTAAGT